jgi:hypothetical protein
MKEIITIIAMLVSLYGGTVVLKNIHNAVRKAALEKAATGLPSLVEMNKHLLAPRRQK